MKLAQFVVTAGHSESDPGAITPDGQTEASLAVELRDIVVSKLRQRGYKVLTDGEWRRNSPLQIALRLIDKAPIAVEIHFNASTNPVARGVECISLPKHKPLAQQMAGEVAGVLSTLVRGNKGWIDQTASARGKLAFVNSGGLILEVCFLSSASDMQSYRARYFLVASAIVRALEPYAQDRL